MDIQSGYTKDIIMIATATTKIFKSNKSQAVRLPKAVELPASITEVSIIAIGNTRIIIPKLESWNDWFDHPQVTDDFMNDREQPDDQLRESL